MSSLLKTTAETQQKSHFRGRVEGTWSLLSRAEAQDHLYVFSILDFMIPKPITCNREYKLFSAKTRENCYRPRQQRQKLVRV